MAKYVGRRYAFGFGKESPRGTAVAPTAWIPWMEVDIEDRAEHVTNENALAVIEDSDGRDLVAQYSEGTFAGKVKNESHALLLLSLFGAPVSATAGGETVVYEHTFDVVQDNQHPSLTLAVKSPNDDLRFPRCVVDRITYNFELGQYANFEAHFLGEKGASATNTVSIASTDYDFTPQTLTAKFAANKAGLGAAGALTVRSATLTIDAQAEREQNLGSADPTDILNKSFMVEGTITFVHNDATQHDLVLNNTEQAIRLYVENATTIGTAEKPSLQFDLSKCTFTDYQKSIGRDDIVTETVSFKAHYDLSTSEMIEAILTNETASY